MLDKFLLLAVAISILGSFSDMSFAARADYHPASLIRIISAPERFNGQKIQVVGYALETGTFSLYPSKEAAYFNDWPSSVQIVDNTEGMKIMASCDDRFVLIYGKLQIKEGFLQLDDVYEVWDKEKDSSCFNRN